MNRKRTQRIAYVLSQDETQVGHRLGVNSLAFDDQRSVLFSAGRDGKIYGWKLRPDETSKRMNHWTDVQAHRHWINDIKLVDGNKALVSASSDVSVKIFRPYDDGQERPQTIGLHHDYVKALASPGSSASWVAAGGLDHKIRLWDLGGNGSVSEIENTDENCPGKGSVYALGANESLVLSGGPDNIVKVFDARAKRQATKLVGHTDNIRSILISKDRTTIVSASSDRTVKLWSLVAGRCLTTFTMHDDSVWSLASTHPRLSIIYSGDKGGMVAKTDLSGSTEPEHGVSVALCTEKEGINDIAVTEHDVWTATSVSSVNRWKNADLSGGIVVPESLKRFRWSDASRTRTSLRTAYAGIHERIGSRTGQEDLIPFRSVLRLSHASHIPSLRQAGFDRNRGSIHSTARKSSLSGADIGGFYPLRDSPEETVEGQNGLIKHVLLNDKRHVMTMDTSRNLVLWDLLLCKAVRSMGKGDLSTEASTINTIEQVPNWCTVDTRTGCLTCILEESHCFDAEVYADDLDYRIATVFKEDQRINLGKWILCLLFKQLIDEEMARDEKYRQDLGAKKRSEGQIISPKPGDYVETPRLESTLDNNVADKNILSNFSGNYQPVTPGMTIRVASPHATASTSEQSKDLQGSGLTEDTVETTGDGYFFPQAATSHESPSASQGSKPKSPDTQAIQQDPSSQGLKSDVDKKETPREPVSPLTRKLWMPFGARKTNRQAVEPTEQLGQSAEETTKIYASDNIPESINGDRMQDTIQEVITEYSNNPWELGGIPHCLITPPPPNEAPPLDLPGSVAVIIQEQSTDAAVAVDLFEGRLFELKEHIDKIQSVAPRWLGDVVYRNRVVMKEVGKIPFVLEPAKGLLPIVTEGGEGERLTANRMLRTRKILAYVAERLQKMDPLPEGVPSLSKTAQMNVKPEDWLELTCQGQTMLPNSTLNTIRTHIWRSGGDIILLYQLSKN